MSLRFEEEFYQKNFEDLEQDRQYSHAQNPRMMVANDGSPIQYCSLCYVAAHIRVNAHYVTGGYSMCETHMRKAVVAKLEGKDVDSLFGRILRGESI